MGIVTLSPFSFYLIMKNLAKTLIPLALGGLAIYFVLKAREAKAEPLKPTLPIIIPEIKVPEPPKMEISEEGVLFRIKGVEIDVPFNLFEFLSPLKRLELKAKPYYTTSVYD